MPNVVTTHAVSPDDVLSLDVVVGEGQLGNVNVYLGAHRIADGADIRGLRLGWGEALVGQTLAIATAVLDIRPETNRTSVSAAVKSPSSILKIHEHEDAVDSTPIHYFYAVRFIAATGGPNE